MDLNREAAYRALLDIEKEDAFSNLAIKEKIELLKPDAPDFVRRLVYGVIENQINIDYYLSKMLTKGIGSIKKQVLILMRLGAYELDYMDSVPDYATINTYVEMTKEHLRGMQGLVNAILRNWKNKKEAIELPGKDDYNNYLSIKYSIHESIAKLLYKQYGEGVESILESQMSSPKLTVRVNTLKMTIPEAIKALENRGYSVSKSNLSER